MAASNKAKNILITGAGPVGLALAVELNRRGIAFRQIDKNSGPTPEHESRALAVNLRTQDLLEQSGISQKIRDAAVVIENANIHWNGRRVTTIDITSYPRADACMLVLPQGASERIMISHLQKSGCEIEWNTELVELDNFSGNPTASIKCPDGTIQTQSFSHVIGCDGAHSITRKNAGIKFSGTSTPAQWSLMDVKYKNSISKNTIGAYLSNEGARAHFPVRTDIMRLISSKSELEDAIPNTQDVEEITWRSNFSISYRMVESFRRENVYLCGDAAHIHSPVGGRGMNLGIEDACWLAWCLDTNNEESYDRARLAAATRVLAQTHAQTRLITGKIPGASIIIRFILPMIMKISFLRTAALRNLLGLDTAPPPWL